MNEPFAFDAELREALAAGPRVAPATVLEGAFEAARSRRQRRPWFRPLDRRAWPTRQPSIANPLVARSLRVVFILALIAAAIAATVGIGARLRDETPEWRLDGAGTLQVLFNEPIAVALSDGRLLVGGWSSSDGRLVEVFDPRTGQPTPIAGDGTSFAMSLQSATALTDDRVLLIYWQHADPVSNGRSFGYVFDPVSNTLGPPIDMVENRMQPGVAASADGRVIVSGGWTNPESGLILDSIEVFDPATDRFAPAGRMGPGRADHNLTPLADGRMLISGGSVSVPRLVPGASGPALVDETLSRQTDLVVLDLATGAQKTIGQVPGFRTARPVALPDGRILFLGSETTRCGQHGNLPSEAFVADAARETVVRAPNVPHTPAIATTLPDGRVLLAGQWQALPGGGCAGGGSEYTIHGWVAIYDPVTGAVLQTPDPLTGAAGLPFDPDRNYRASVLLPDGRVALIEENFEGAGPNAVDIIEVAPQQAR